MVSYAGVHRSLANTVFMVATNVCGSWVTFFTSLFQRLERWCGALIFRNFVERETAVEIETVAVLKTVWAAPLNTHLSEISLQLTTLGYKRPVVAKTNLRPWALVISTSNYALVLSLNCNYSNRGFAWFSPASEIHVTRRLIFSHYMSWRLVPF